MTTPKQVKLAIGRIISRKREKNRALANEQKQPKFQLIAMFAEVQKELEKSHSVSVSPTELDSVLLTMVRARDIVPEMKGFTLPGIIAGDSESITKHWSK